MKACLFIFLSLPLGFRWDICDCPTLLHHATASVHVVNDVTRTSSNDAVGAVSGGVVSAADDVAVVTGGDEALDGDSGIKQVCHHSRFDDDDDDDDDDYVHFYSAFFIIIIAMISNQFSTSD